MTEEQTEEIRGLIVALSSTNEETFKYKGSTYLRDATTASTAEVPSLKKAAEKKFGQLTSPMVEATYVQNGNELTMNTTIYKTESNVYETVSEAEKMRAVPEGGFKRNEMVFVTSDRTRAAFNKSQLSMADKELKQKLNRNEVYGMRGQAAKLKRYTNKDAEYQSLIEKHPELKAAVTEMQTAIDNSVFKGTIGVGIGDYGATIAVYRYYISTKRFGNRANAYSERYKELQSHLAPSMFIK